MNRPKSDETEAAMWVRLLKYARDARCNVLTPLPLLICRLSLSPLRLAYASHYVHFMYHTVCHTRFTSDMKTRSYTSLAVHIHYIGGSSEVRLCQNTEFQRFHHS